MRDDRFMHIELTEDQRGHVLIGQTVGELNLPEDCLLTMIERGDDEIEPTDDQKLQAGDRLTFVGQPKDIEQLKDQYGLVDSDDPTELYE